MRRLRSVLLVAAIILALDLVAAQYCRGRCDFWETAYPPVDHRVRFEPYHHTLAPNRQIHEAWGLARYRYATNSLGFKDAAPRDVALVGDRPRVLFLGDSFTEGKGFPYPDTFVGLVAGALARRGVEVLNGAVDSYAPVIYRLKAKHLLDTVGLRFDACVVFLDVSDIYDEQVRYHFDADGRLIVPPVETDDAATRTMHFLRDNSALARLGSVVYDHLYFLYRVVLRRWQIAEAWNKPFADVDGMDIWVYIVTGLKYSAWTYDDARWRDYGRAGRQRAADDMEGLLSLLRARGIPLIVAVYPWPDQMFHDPKAPRHKGFWKEWSRARGVPFIDLFPAFTGDDPRQVLKRYFLGNDFHWNADGHRLVARIVLEQLPLPNTRAGR